MSNTTTPSLPLSAEQLDNLEALARAATPGPWAYQEDSDAYTHIIRPVASPGWIIASATQTSKPEGEANGRWIAAANPAMVLALIAQARTAQQATASRGKTSERALLDMAVEAGLWPNTIHHWMPALRRYTDAVLARASHGAQAPDDELHIGVSNNDMGVHIVITQRHADGSATVIYSAACPKGDHYGRAALANLASSAKADMATCGNSHQSPYEPAQQMSSGIGELVVAAATPASDTRAAVPDGWKIERVGSAIHLKRADGKWCGYSMDIDSPAHRLTYEFLNSALAISPTAAIAEADAKDAARLDWLESNQATLSRLYNNSGYILAVDGKAVRTDKSARAAIDFAMSATQQAQNSEPLKCWSCEQRYDLRDHADNDGHCPNCGVEIEADEQAQNSAKGSGE